MKYRKLKKILTKIIFQIWKEKERNLIDKINEARDNVKYLYKVESICQKFYTNDMVRKILLLLSSFLFTSNFCLAVKKQENF